jgi:hypothetical protein
MSKINSQSNSQLAGNGQSIDGLGQPNPLTTDEVIRRGQEAMGRKRRSYEDWLLIAEALQVGRTEVMRTIHTNKPAVHLDDIGEDQEEAPTQWNKKTSHQDSMIEQLGG